jgi:phosphoadenosine phosphosulfate reductase
VDLKADPEKREKLNQESGGKPYEKNPDYCCQINKVEPLDEALKGLDAWISGIRRSQSKTRREIKIIEEYQGGIFKINPLANVTSGDIWWYIKEHDLLRHPLFDKGYLSIGCWPCTRPIQPGDDERSGRWAGRDKTECGLHTFLKPKEEKRKMELPEEKQSGSGI